MDANEAPRQRDPRVIAGTLADATRDVLLCRVGDWIPSTLSLPPITVRVGSGRATYCRQDHQGIRINYGSRMVAEKCLPAAASGWLTTREIHERGYFRGEASAPHLLAHTVCHEFAHLLQGVLGWRRRGSVHDRGFYRLLDMLHGDGTAAAVLAYIQERHGPVLSAAPQVRHHAAAPAPVTPGDPVSFTLRDGSTVRGRVHRVNRLTVSVLPDRPQQPGQYYRVPHAFLRRRTPGPRGSR